VKLSDQRSEVLPGGSASQAGSRPVITLYLVGLR
jgi:hypothetical protein